MNVLAIAVHPDDETLGCGGALLRHAHEGDSLHWLLVTAADAKHYDEATRAVQEAQVTQVSAAYPFESQHWLKQPTAHLDLLPTGDLVRLIGAAIAEIRPEVVYVPSVVDVHSDHQIVHQASMSVLKAFSMKSLGVRRILACEVVSETDAGAGGFTPDVFVDVTDHLERKIAIFANYVGQEHEEWLPRTASSIRALARHRGATVGVEYAEAFHLIRELL